MRSAAFALLVLAACKVDGAPSGGSSSGPAPSVTSAPAPAPARAPATSAAPPTQLAPAASDRPASLDHFARERRQRLLDTDGDGVISDAERAAARQKRVDAIRAKLDTNSDGILTAAELAAARVYTFDAATVDADHDGNISVDELDPVVVQRFRRFER